MEAQLRAYIARLKQPCGCDYQCGCGLLDAYQVGVYLESILSKESKMITAAEARQRVDETIEGEAKAWLDKAEQAINKAILNKQYSTTQEYNSTIFAFVKKYLESEPNKYKVEYVASSGGFGGGGSYVRIEW